MAPSQKQTHSVRMQQTSSSGSIKGLCECCAGNIQEAHNCCQMGLSGFIAKAAAALHRTTTKPQNHWRTNFLPSTPTFRSSTLIQEQQTTDDKEPSPLALSLRRRLLLVGLEAEIRALKIIIPEFLNHFPAIIRPLLIQET